MCFLPLSHIFERAWTHFALSQGMVVNVCDDTAKIVEYLQQVKPTIMCAVPRFYEKIYATVFEKLESAPPLKKKLFLWAIGVGGQAFLLTKEQQPVPLHPEHQAQDRRGPGVEEDPGGRRRPHPLLPLRRGAPLEEDRGVLPRGRD